MEFKIGQFVKTWIDHEPYTGIIRSIGSGTVEVEINDTFSITIDKRKVIDYKKFDIGELVTFYEDGSWNGEGIVTGYTENCVGRKLVKVKELNSNSELVFYEHEVLKISQRSTIKL